MGWRIRLGELDLGDWYKDGREQAIGHLLDCIMVTPDGTPRGWQDIPGYFDFPDLYQNAVDWAKEGAVFVELGCWQGRSTRYMAETIAASGKSIRFDVFDNFSYQVATLEQTRANMGTFGSFVNIHSIPSVEAAARYDDGTVDFCFVDGDHNRAIDDLRAWWPKIREGGVLAGHDVEHAGVRPALLSFFNAIPRVSQSSWAMTKTANGGGRPYVLR